MAGLCFHRQQNGTLTGVGWQVPAAVVVLTPQRLLIKRVCNRRITHACKSGCERHGGVVLLAAVFLTATAAIGGDKARIGTTAENLAVACQAELQSHARYLAFAEKADNDGYHQIASMFRAIARGEEIHGSLMAALAGSETLPAATAMPEAITVGSTRQNLESALRDQVAEHNDLYPRYLKRAQRDNNVDAARLFEHIILAEATHRAWYQQVLKAMDSYTATGAEFYVCPDCGTVSRSAKHVCPSCSAPKQRFEKVT